MNKIPACKCPKEPFPKVTFFAFFIMMLIVLLILSDNRHEVVRVLNKDFSDISRYWVAPNFDLEVLVEIFYKFSEYLTCKRDIITEPFFHCYKVFNKLIIFSILIKIYIFRYNSIKRYND